MPDPKPMMVYEELSGEKSQIMDYAEETAKLTLPTLAPRGEKIEERPWTSKGTAAVRALASATLKIEMPPGVLWGRVDLPPEAWNELDARVMSGDADEALVMQLKERIKARSLDMMESLKQKNTRSRTASLLLRNLVEGNNAINNTPEGMRVYPLRSMVNRRNEFSEVDMLCLHEHILPSPTAVQEAGDLGKELNIYTLIDYERDMVWQQMSAEGGEGKVVKLEDEDPVHYWVVVPERPDVGHYAIPYAYNFIRLIASIDHAEASLAEAMAYAAWNPVGIREGSVLAQNPNQIMMRDTSKPIVMQEQDLIFPDKANKLGEWAFVSQMRNEDTDELAQVFAMGIKDRALSADTSATAILEIVDELNTQTQDLLSSYEDTFQRPLLRSENRIHEAVNPLFTSEQEKILAALLRIVVTTGVNALEKQRTMARFVMQIVPAVKAMDERVQANGIEMLDRVAEGMLLNTEGLYTQMDPLEMQLRQMMNAGAFDQMGLPSGGGASANGGLPRERTMMTRGGPQPPQPSQGPPPV